jgi:hypothetical protein
MVQRGGENDFGALVKKAVVLLTTILKNHPSRASIEPDLDLCILLSINKWCIRLDRSVELLFIRWESKFDGLVIFLDFERYRVTDN